jgi:hypothetical protein
MSLATVLKVFKKSSLITKQGEFKINRVFHTVNAVQDAGYRYCGKVNNITLYARRGKTGNTTFAMVDE